MCNECFSLIPTAPKRTRGAPRKCLFVFHLCDEKRCPLRWCSTLMLGCSHACICVCVCVCVIKSNVRRMSHQTLRRKYPICNAHFLSTRRPQHHIILSCLAGGTQREGSTRMDTVGLAVLSCKKKRSKKDAAKRVVGAQRGHKINITIIIIFIITTNLCMCIHAFLCRPGRFGSRAAAGPPAKPHTRLCRCGEAVAVFLLLLAIHCAFFLH